MTRIFSGVMLVMFCVGVLALALRIQPVKADEQLELTMTVEKTDYYVGEPINVTLTVTNISNQTITFQYWAKTFDFLVYNDTGYIYQWSKFGAHPFVIVDLSLDPGENMARVLTWPQTCNDTAISQGSPVSPGAYHIYGYFVSFDALYELETGPIEVNVDQPISLVPSKTVVGQGYVLPLNVSLINLDDPPWAFDVTLSTNATTIETETGINVSRGTSTLSFSWNTAGFEPGHYSLNVLAGNLSAGSSVVLTIPGDVNADFQVSLPDLVNLAQSYGSKSGDPNWNPNADIDGNGVVDLSDLVVLAQHYGQQQLQVVGASVDLYDQYPAPYGGQGPNAHSDAFAPQDLVILYAKVTLGGERITNALVSFEIDNAEGQSIAILQNYTDAEGVSTVAFRLPMTIFGWWKVVATTAVDQNVVNDTMAFQ